MTVTTAKEPQRKRKVRIIGGSGTHCDKHQWEGETFELAVSVAGHGFAAWFVSRWAARL
jgi:hypothetical protein